MQAAFVYSAAVTVDLPLSTGDDMDKILKLGLTGGIAAGKSAVSAMLRELGAVIIDVDLVAREIVRPGEPALREIAEAFGPEVLQEDGTLNRRRLAGIVFGNQEQLAKLNAITHPRLVEAVGRIIGEVEDALNRACSGDTGASGGAQKKPVSFRVAEALKDRPDPSFPRVVSWSQPAVSPLVIVIDAAVLFESGLARMADKVLVVSADYSVRLARLMKRNNLTEEEARARMDSNYPASEMLKHADYVVDNTGTLEETRRQVEAVWDALRGGG